jgi:beta-glucosidase
MKIFSVTFLFVLSFISCVISQDQSSPATNSAEIAVKGTGEWWQIRHQEISDRLTLNPELILVGNSIFHTLDEEDRKIVWEKYLSRYQTVNMGISGDRTENVIWRLQNGALDGINPKLAIILIGTNNTDGNHYLNISTPEELEKGIWKICEIIREKLPATKILLLGILPYGYKPNHRDEINKETNSLIAEFPGRDSFILYRDIRNLYLDKDGQVNKDLMPDFLHPNTEGHLLMFEALDPDIAAIVR